MDGSFIPKYFDNILIHCYNICYTIGWIRCYTFQHLHLQGYIKETYDRIRSLRPSVEADADQSGTSESCQYDDFITFLFGGSLDESSSSNGSKFAQQVKAQDAEPRQNFNTDIWDYWLKREKTHPEMHEVAMVVLAAPSNQVSVERGFSALALVLSPQRTRLGPDTLENILLIKLNKEVFMQVIPNYVWKDV